MQVFLSLSQLYVSSLLLSYVHFIAPHPQLISVSQTGEVKHSTIHSLTGNSGNTISTNPLFS